MCKYHWEDFHGKNVSLVGPTMKCRSHEGFKSLLKNSSSDTHKGSSNLGSGHIEIARSERTDAAPVSSILSLLYFLKIAFQSLSLKETMFFKATVK